MTDSSDVDFEDRLRRSASRRRMVLVAVAAVAVIAAAVVLVTDFMDQRQEEAEDGLAPEIVLTGEQEQQLDATIAESRARIDALDRPWRAAIAGIEPTQMPGGASPCEALGWAARGLASNPQAGDWGSWKVVLPLGFNAGSSASLTRTPFPLAFFAKDAPLPGQSPEAAHRLAKLDRLANGGSSHTTFEQRISAATIDELRVTDVLVRLDTVVEPKLEPGELFVPGRLVGSVWVFDHRTDKVVCAGVVEATSSTTVDPRSSNLNDDLMINFVRALPNGLHAID